MYNDALSAVHLNTQVNQGIGGGIAVWEVPTISYPPTPNPSVQCKVCKNMEWIPFISLINRIPRSSQLIQGYSHLRHYEKTSFNSRFTSCTMCSSCNYLNGQQSALLFSKVQPTLIFSHQSYPSSPILGTCHPLFMSRAPTICEILFPPTFHAPPPTILSGGHAALFD